ncbi:MAG: PKD domain-containing protein [Chloroflexota bacterium]
MNHKRVMILLGVMVALVLAALPVMAAPDTLTVSPFVESQVCLNGDTVEVTLSATSDSTSSPVYYRWDFTNNGSFDTRFNTDPTVTHNYTDEVTRTARVRAANPEGNRATATVTFTTLRCTN